MQDTADSPSITEFVFLHARYDDLKIRSVPYVSRVS